MAITNVMGFDDVVLRTDNQILHIEGYPLKWVGGNSSLSTVSEPVLGERTVLRTVNTGSINAGTMQAKASDVFHQWKDIRTKWYFGFRVRSETNIGNATLGDGCGLTFSLLDSIGIIIGSPFSSEELGYYTTNDRYVYMEVCLNWIDKTIERWIDGYRQPDIDMSESLADADDFMITLGRYSPSGSTANHTSRWTDIYFMVDTSSIEGDETPSERLGGALVRHLGVDVVDFTTGWETSTTGEPKDLLNTPMSSSISSRLYPNVITSIAENPSTFYMELPEPGENHRLGRGEILFLQMGLNAHRFDGSTAQLYATPVDALGNEGEEISLTMYVDDYEGRPVAHFNKSLSGVDWTPELVKQHGLKLYTRSGGV